MNKKLVRIFYQNKLFGIKLNMLYSFYNLKSIFYSNIGDHINYNFN